MLQTLSIKNVALITNLTVDFSKGFNVLLGETGAGKSIIFDSLNFVLGAKADRALIRYGENEMRVEALFSDLSASCKHSLAQLGFEEDEICLSRSLNTEGRSNIRINGALATQSTLKEVGALLVNSYSQHENVELLKTKNHLLMLDRFGGDRISLAKTKVHQLYQSYSSILKQIQQLGGDEFERERMASLLKYQIEEIENANLKIGEDEEIYDRLKFLNNAERIFQAISVCEELLRDGTSSCIRSLQETSATLSSLLSFDEIEQCKNRIDSVRYELEDVYDTLVNIKASTDFDEKEFDLLDRRNDLIKSLNKKYGGSIETVLNFLSDAKEKFNAISDSEYLLAKLDKEKEKSYQSLNAACKELTAMRKETALNIETKILKELKDLGMKSSMFSVKFETLNQPTQNGMDVVEFEFSANKGLDVKSLSKTASGGELSRFMLAVKNIFTEIEEAQTFVFDEIDSGISGETGNIVGEKINNISKNAQILCITHLPQVAVYADNILFVSKNELDNTTTTQIRQVQSDEIVKVIAQMTVGDSITETSIKQAQEMRNKTGK